MQNTNRRGTTTTVTTPKGTTVKTDAPTRSGASSSERKQRRDALLAAIRLRYWALTPELRNGFQRLCRQIPGNLVIGKTGMKQRVTTFLFFSLLNQAAWYSGASASVTEPVDSPQYPDEIPPTLKLVSAYDAQGKWSLKLAGAVYGNSVSIALAPAAMETSNYQLGDYVQAGPLPLGLPSKAGVDVTQMFLDIYPVAPLVGEKVSAQLMGVLPSGFATAKVLLPTMTTGPAAADTNEDGARQAA